MQTAQAIWQGALIDFGPPAALLLAYCALQVAQAHGWRTTYAAALLRAVGQGQIAAAAQGVSLFSPAGRLVAIKVGTDYLTSTVGAAAAGLGITDADHAVRIVGQIGAIEAAAQAALLPSITRVPADTVVPVAAPG